MADNIFENFLKEPVKPVSEPVNFIEQSFNEAFAKEEANGVSGTKGPGITYASPDIDRYRFQEDFKALGFDPNDSSHFKSAVASETWGTAMSKGLDSFSSRFGATFSDYWKDYGRMADALVHWDMQKMLPSESKMIDQYYRDQKESLKNSVFVPVGEEDNFFSKKFMSEMVGNSGFALGTIAAMAIELVADTALTLLTAPAGGGGAVSYMNLAGKLGAMLGKKTLAKNALLEGAEQITRTGAKRGVVSDIFHGFVNGSREVSELKHLSATRKQLATIEELNLKLSKKELIKETMKDFYQTISFPLNDIMNAKTFADRAMGVGKMIPIAGEVLRYGEKIAEGAKYGMSTGKLVGIGIQGLRRTAQEVNMSATEATFEGITTFGDTFTQMVEQYKQTHDGQIPPPEEFERMKANASKASMANYKTNLAVLMVTNQIQFGNIFSKLKVQNRFMKEIMEEGTEKWIGVNRISKGALNIGQQYEKKFMGTYGLLPKIAKDFGKKQALWEFTKAFSRDFMRFEVTEGLQENIQEMSASAWKNYYASQGTNTQMTLEKAFDKGAAEQLTKRGWLTFLSGAMTGSLIRVPTMAIQKTTTYLSNKSMEYQYRNNPESNPVVMADKQIRQNMTMMNDIYASMRNKTFGDKVFNLNTQINSALNQSEAAAKNDAYEFHNNHDNSLIAAALVANRSGMIKTFVQAVKDMGAEMTPEEFSKQFGFKIEDTKFSSPAEFASDVADKLHKYSKEVDKITANVKNMADPTMYATGTENRLVAEVMRNAQEEAIKVTALNKIKASRAGERALGVTNNLMSIPGMKDSSAYTLKVLTNTRNVLAEAGMIADEMRLLKQTLESDISPEQKTKIRQQIADKQEESELLTDWLKLWSTRKKVLETSDVRYSTDKNRNITYVVDKDNKIVKDAEGRRIRADETDEVEFGKADTIFVGKKLKEDVNYLDEDGNVIYKHAGYDEKHEDVISLFHEIVNLKNKQAGISTQVNQEDLRQGITHIIDFMKLERDSLDYMDAVNVMSNPESYKATTARIAEGYLKFQVLNSLSTIESRISKILDSYVDVFMIKDYYINKDSYYANKDAIEKELIDKVLNSKEYKATETIINTEFNAGKQQVLADNINAIERMMISECLKIAAKYDKFGIVLKMHFDQTDMTDMDKISQDLKDVIAIRLSNNYRLAPYEELVYKSHKEEIDAKVIRTEPAEQTQVVDAFETPEELAESEVSEEVAPETFVATPVEATPTTYEIDPLLLQFEAQQTPEGTGEVVVNNGDSVIDTATVEEANELKEALDITASDIEFMKTLVDEGTDILKISQILDTWRDAMEKFNKKHDKSFKSVELFYKSNPQIRGHLGEIRNSIITGKEMTREAEKQAVIINPITEKIDVIETMSSTQVAAFTIDDIQGLHDRLQPIRPKQETATSPTQQRGANILSNLKGKSGTLSITINSSDSIHNYHSFKIKDGKIVDGTYETFFEGEYRDQKTSTKHEDSQAEFDKLMSQDYIFKDHLAKYSKFRHGSDIITLTELVKQSSVDTLAQQKADKERKMQENDTLGKSILQKLGYKNENRQANGNVKGGQSGWKIRFNIKSTTGENYFNKGNKVLENDKHYNEQAQKLVDWLNNYFQTTSKGSVQEAIKGYNLHGFNKENPSSIWKFLSGGEQGEADFTIYIGSADDVLKFVKDVKSSPIANLLVAGNQGSDVSITTDGIFKARIEGASIGFSGYGAPTNLNNVTGKNDFTFVFDGKRVNINYGKTKNLSDILITVEGGNAQGVYFGYKVVGDENLKKDFPELYKNIRNIIGFQLYGNYLQGSNNEFLKLTGVDKINAKYAELANLSSEKSEKSDKFVEKDPIKEQDILDQIKKINIC